MVAWKINLEEIIKKVNEVPRGFKKVEKLLPISRGLEKSEFTGVTIRNNLFYGSVSLVYFSKKLTINEIIEMKNYLNDILAPYNIKARLTKYILKNGKEYLAIYFEIFRSDIRASEVANYLIDLINYLKSKTI